jgi:hypothetical protein
MDHGFVAGQKGLLCRCGERQPGPPAMLRAALSDDFLRDVLFGNRK